jgi:Zn-dependent peptidase ImmA (M78 family)
MKRISTDTAEDLAIQFRAKAELNLSEPVHVKTILQKMRILTLYRPLSEHSDGLSLKSPDNKSFFMLVNSNATRGRQHFTIAHEFFHLFYDEHPEPHFCSYDSDEDSIVEKNANAFASALLMPKEGLFKNIPSEEIVNRNISMATLLKLEQYFSVSHFSLLLRMKALKLMTEAEINEQSECKIKEIARLYGYDTSLYESGNANLVIGDFGAKARLLFERGKISEGHYLELLNMIANGKS